MPASSVLRLNMTGLCADPADEARRYQAAVEMAEYVDRHGFSVVNVEEHHCAENGWLPSPLTVAAMVAARTEKVRINVAALLITLYDPIRLAEDIAVIDLVSGGRFSFIAGSGYRDLEYHAMDKEWSERGRLMDECIEALLAAWTGEPFEYRGRSLRVTPRPVSQPHPFFFVGGMSRVAARRAARFGLPFYPPMKMPELEAYYLEECQRQGTQGFVFSPVSGNSMIYLAADPEAAWEELGPYFLNESQEYARWKQEGVPRPSEQAAESIDDLRAERRYVLLTPEKCVEYAAGLGDGSVVLHPLAGGIPLERAWEMLRLYVEEVMPRL